MRVEQNFYAPVASVVGHVRQIDCLSVDDTHLEWLNQQTRDEEFKKRTGISATGRDRKLLQRLQVLGARTEHMSLLWKRGLLFAEGDQLRIRRSAWSPWLAGATYLFFIYLALPFAIDAYLLRQYPFFTMALLVLFGCAVGYGAWTAKSLVYPWQLAARLTPLVDSLNQQVRQETIAVAPLVDQMKERVTSE